MVCVYCYYDFFECVVVGLFVDFIDCVFDLFGFMGDGCEVVCDGEF